ncbi:oxygenase MpaB family protein [Quadrisphaera setariae]|uniref:DUF2236 domain-containing protein n=1 Tax=Quadrisphaera setariae TaxID=2593304 RepID=A0A5C8Z5R3_9ACTN|nr:oxygenase MpaB family protein [Quadrisphaera setariae]TXR52471.1 DUF2236 domain-containing protein [Quadrisphaera setariae]
MNAEGSGQVDPPEGAPGCLTSERLQHAQATYRALVQEHYPVEFSIGHRLAYLRTYASPRVAGLLVQTGHVAHTPLKRATDTGLFIYELIHAGFDSETGEHVVARLRAMHLRWKIRNEDHLWVLGTFVVLSLRLIDQVSHRPLSEDERQATVDFYRELGTRMGVQDVPADFATFAATFDAYELANLRRSPAGQQLLAATWRAALSTMPAVLRPFTGQAIAALTTEPARTALGLDRPSALTRSAVFLALRTHSRTGVLASTAPQFTPGGPQVVYPGGYRLEQLGPDDAEDAQRSLD